MSRIIVVGTGGLLGFPSSGQNMVQGPLYKYIMTFCIYIYMVPLLFCCPWNTLKPPMVAGLKIKQNEYKY